MKLRSGLLLLAAAAAAAPLAAQDVHLRGDDRTRAAQLAREVLQRGSYLRIDRDTVLPATFHAPGDLVVVDADVRLEGRVDGTAVVLGGHLFLRPGSRVAGPIAVVGGGVYPSGRAEYGTIFESSPQSRVAVETSDSGMVARIEPPPGKPRLSYGPQIPTYDRVNGGTFGARAGFRLTPREPGAAVDAWIAYRQRNEHPWGGGVRLQVPLVQGVRFLAEGSRATRTNDAWAVAHLPNTVAVLVGGVDYRDYYDADRLIVGVGRPLGKPLISGESWLGPRAAVQVEEARTLVNQHPWSLFGELERENPPVLDGQINSVLGGAELHWVGRVSRFSVDAEVEHGQLVESFLEVEGDSFTQLRAHASYSATAFRTHQLRYRLRVVLPLGTAAPPQRHLILGGVPTIPTLDVGAMRGDHLVYTAGTYSIPYPRVTLPVLGFPTLEVGHVVGAAWSGGAEPDWVQNLVAGVRFSFVAVRAAIDPADPDRRRVWVAVSMLQP